jgi:hypothetical protein
MIQHAGPVEVQGTGESARDLQSAGEIEIQIAVVGEDKSTSEGAVVVQGAGEGAYAGEGGTPVH